jgi:hypothetical protein
MQVESLPMTAAAKESAMPNQDPSRDGMPRKDQDRPSPDVAHKRADGAARGTGDARSADGRTLEQAQAGDENATPKAGASSSSPDYRGDGPAKVGLTSDDQPDLVAPSGVNERDHGAADDRPAAGGELNFDDGTDMVHPRGKVTSAGRAWDEKNPSDAGDLGAPNAGLSDRNGPSDPDAKRSR